MNQYVDDNFLGNNAVSIVIKKLRFLVLFIRTVLNVSGSLPKTETAPEYIISVTNHWFLDLINFMNATNGHEKTFRKLPQTRYLNRILARPHTQSMRVNEEENRPMTENSYEKKFSSA
jgi:hypothetical protein